MASSGQIIAMGGGGFSMEPESPLMDRYILNLAGKRSPKVCFLTPGADETAYAYRFFTAFSRHDCRASHLSLLRPATADLSAMIHEQDVIYVGGGNTKSMLALWREWRVDQALRSAWERGVVLAGLSAGAICWFDQGLTDSIPGPLQPLPCLGLLKGSCTPHYDGEAGRRPALHRLIAEGAMMPGWALEDGVKRFGTPGCKGTRTGA